MQELFKYLLVPPAINVLCILLGLLLMRWLKGTAILIILLSIISLWFLATPIGASKLQKTIEDYPTLDLEQAQDAKAIVMAGSSHHNLEPEYGTSTPSNLALARLHYSVFLHRRTGLPILVTGGYRYRPDRPQHASVLHDSLTKEFQIQNVLVELQSTNTKENALYSAALLHRQGITKVILVTHSYHMRRAARRFKEAGFEVYAAPTRLSEDFGIMEWYYWVPQSQSLQISAAVMYEYMALLRNSFDVYRESAQLPEAMPTEG